MSVKGIVPIRFAILVVLVPAICLAYLSLDTRCEVLGRELKALDVQIEDLNRQCLNEELRWMRMKSPGEIDKALHRWHLDMTWPDERQIVRFTNSDVKEALDPDRRGVRTQFAQAGGISIHD